MFLFSKMARGTERGARLELPPLGLDRRALGNPPAVRPLPRPWRERGLNFFTISKEAPFGIFFSSFWHGFVCWTGNYLIGL